MFLKRSSCSLLRNFYCNSVPAISTFQQRFISITPKVSAESFVLNTHVWIALFVQKDEIRKKCSGFLFGWKLFLMWQLISVTQFNTIFSWIPLTGQNGIRKSTKSTVCFTKRHVRQRCVPEQKQRSRYLNVSVIFLEQWKLTIYCFLPDVKNLTFPCNQFAHEIPEKDDEEMVDHFKEAHARVFDVFAKVHVSSTNAVPIHKFLKNRKDGFVGDGIKWNFTKFLIDKGRQSTDWFASTTTQSSVAENIDELKYKFLKIFSVLSNVLSNFIWLGAQAPGIYSHI